jgi:hypothetical protein
MVAAAMLPVLVRARRAEHAEGGVRTAEQPDARNDQGADQQDAGDGADHAHQSAALPGGVGEHGTGLMPARVRRSLHVTRLSHEASVGEMARGNTNNRAYQYISSCAGYETPSRNRPEDQ